MRCLICLFVTLYRVELHLFAPSAKKLPDPKQPLQLHLWHASHIDRIVCIHVCMCVWTICTDVKLPLFGWWFCFVSTRFWTMFAGGTWSMDRSGANEDTYPMLVISRLITVTYLPIFSEMGRGWTQEPPCRSFEFSLHCTDVAIWKCFRYNLYGSATSEPSSEQGRRKHTSHWISRWINHFLLSDFNGLFVHVRCIPHQ